MLRATCVLLLSSLTVAVAQQPAISNAKLQTASASAGLEAAVKTAISTLAAPFWIGYSVPVVSGERQSCCWDNNSRGCGLEERRGSISVSPTGPVKLEGPTHFTVLLRVDGGDVKKIRGFSGDCPLDAGGLTVQWLTDVSPAQSVAMLERDATQNTAEHTSDGAIHVIAMHLGPEADKSIETFAQSGTEKQRKSAMFWLGNSRGRKGYEVVSRIARQDTNERIREHATFVLTQTKETEAIPTLIRMAREDASARVRGQALFWLAQKAARQGASTINEAIDNDPDTDVKKKAVFALTQLPKEEGVPMLIQVARTNRNAAVRKQAMFWLGQSKDPRALKFFEDVLTK